MSNKDPQDAGPRWLDALQEVPERDATRAAEGRQAYLQAVEEIREPVSGVDAGRHKGWMSKFRKERSPMFSFARILIVLALALGGTGTTAAYAAQSSLPGDPLYGVKLALEDFRLGLTRDPQHEVLLLEDLVETRLEEIGALVRQGEPINLQLMNRLETHLRLALQQSAQLDDPQLIQTMEQIRTRAEQQLQIMQQLRTNAPEDQDEALRQTEQALLRIRNTAQDAIEDPTTFRLRLGTERSDEAPDQPDFAPPGSNGEGSGPKGPGEPQGPNGSNSGGGSGRP
ncbi:MAG: DUF5667 domain-containing protein [Anaerolineales bacterium]